MWSFTPAEKYAVTLTSAHTLIKLPVGMTEQLTYSYMLSLSTGETPFSFTSPTLPPAFSSLNHSFPHPSELSLCCNTPNKCRPLELSLLLFLPREALKSFEICHSSLHVFVCLSVLLSTVLHWISSALRTSAEHNAGEPVLANQYCISTSTKL